MTQDFIPPQEMKKAFPESWRNLEILWLLRKHASKQQFFGGSEQEDGALRRLEQDTLDEWLPRKVLEPQEDWAKKVFSLMAVKDYRIFGNLPDFCTECHGKESNLVLGGIFREICGQCKGNQWHYASIAVSKDFPSTNFIEWQDFQTLMRLVILVHEKGS